MTLESEKLTRAWKSVVASDTDAYTIRHPLMQRNEVLSLLALQVQKVLTLKALLEQRNEKKNEVLSLLALLAQNVQILTLKALLVQRNERQFTCFTSTDTEGAARAAKRAK